MTNRMREEEEGVEIVSEWKFAAMVIDRYLQYIHILVMFARFI